MREAQAPLQKGGPAREQTAGSGARHEQRRAPRHRAAVQHQPRLPEAAQRNAHVRRGGQERRAGQGEGDGAACRAPEHDAAADAARQRHEEPPLQGAAHGGTGQGEAKHGARADGGEAGPAGEAAGDAPAAALACVL